MHLAEVDPYFTDLSFSLICRPSIIRGFSRHAPKVKTHAKLLYSVVNQHPVKLGRGQVCACCTLNRPIANDPVLSAAWNDHKMTLTSLLGRLDDSSIDFIYLGQEPTPDSNLNDEVREPNFYRKQSTTSAELESLLSSPRGKDAGRDDNFSPPALEVLLQEVPGKTKHLNIEDVSAKTAQKSLVQYRDTKKLDAVRLMPGWGVGILSLQKGGEGSISAARVATSSAHLLDEPALDAYADFPAILTQTLASQLETLGAPLSAIKTVVVSLPGVCATIELFQELRRINADCAIVSPGLNSGWNPILDFFEFAIAPRPALLICQDQGPVEVAVLC